MGKIILRFVNEDDELDAQIRRDQYGFWASHVEAIVPDSHDHHILRYDDAHGISARHSIGWIRRLPPSAPTRSDSATKDAARAVTLAERWQGNAGTSQPAARQPARLARAGAACALPLLVRPGLEAALQQPPSLRPGSRIAISAGPRTPSPGPPSLTWCRVQ